MPLPPVVQTGAPGDPIRLDAFQTIRGYSFGAGRFLALEYQSANECSPANGPPDAPDCVISDCNLPGVTTLSMLGASFTVLDPLGTGTPPVNQIITPAMRTAYLAWSYVALNDSGTRSVTALESTFEYTNGANVAIFNLDKIKRALSGADFVFKVTLGTGTFINSAWLGSILAKLYHNRTDFRAKADMGLTGIGMDSNPQTPPNFGFPGALLGGRSTIPPPFADGEFGFIQHGVEVQRIGHFFWSFDTNSGTLTLDP